MREEGVQYTCSRCGKKEFVAWEPLRNKYPTDSNWTKVTEDIWLCPRCGAEFADKFRLFMDTKTIRLDDI